ncbi:MDC1 protein, partial [Alaudala cheleensis]|nr:MDC1 protein [Alaudala cheleensis]
LETPNPDVPGTQRGCETLQGDSETDVEEEEADPDVRPSKRRKNVSPPTTPRRVPEIPDVEAETPNPDVGGPCPDPDVATQLFLAPHPDVERPESPGRAPAGRGIPDVEWEPPSPDVGGAPSPAQEEAEPPPTPQVRFGGSWLSFGGSQGCPQCVPNVPSCCSRSCGTLGCPQCPLSPPGMSPVCPQPIPVSPNPSQCPQPVPECPRCPHLPQSCPQSVPTLSQCPQCPQVLFTGLVASPALLVALGTLGGTEATSVSNCSHLVTDGIRRTLKFLCALGRGVPIVTPQWLLQSSVSGRPLSPGPFLPRDPPRERRFGF